MQLQLPTGGGGPIITPHERRLHVLASQLRRQQCTVPRRLAAAFHQGNSPTAVLRVAVAGCHRQTSRALGSHNFSAAVDLNPDVEVVAVFDHGALTRAAYVECWGGAPSGGVVKSYDTLAGMLAPPRGGAGAGACPDIVVVAARQTMHAEMVEAAVAAGARGVLVDKPLCTSLDECDRIVAACEGAGVPLLFALDRRWSTRWQALRTAMAAGCVGTVQSVVVSGVNNTVNHGCHYADLALGLMGDPEPVWVSAQLTTTPIRVWAAPPPADTGALDPPSYCTVGCANHAVLILTPAGGEVGVEVVGDSGRLVVWGDAACATVWRRGSGREQGPQELSLPAEEDASQWLAGQRMVADLVHCVRLSGADSSSGRTESTRTACDVDCARRATEIAFGAHYSSDRGGLRVELPLAQRSMRIESLPWGNENASHPDAALSSNPNNPWAQQSTTK